MRIERELLKGVLPLAVLKLLKRRPMYGYELVTQVARQSDGVLELGQSTLYPLLYNLEAQGLIESEWVESGGSRPRKYYKPTGKGLRRLERDLAQWQALVRGMGELVTGVQSLHAAPPVAVLITRWLSPERAQRVEGRVEG